MTGSKELDMKFCKELMSDHPEIIEVIGIDKAKTDMQWYRCPYCGKSLFPVRNDTKIYNMPFRCKAGKHDIEVNI